MVTFTHTWWIIKDDIGNTRSFTLGIVTYMRLVYNMLWHTTRHYVMLCSACRKSLTFASMCFIYNRNVDSSVVSLYFSFWEIYDISFHRFVIDPFILETSSVKIFWETCNETKILIIIEWHSYEALRFPQRSWYGQWCDIFLT